MLLPALLKGLMAATEIGLDRKDLHEGDIIVVLDNRRGHVRCVRGLAAAVAGSAAIQTVTAVATARWATIAAVAAGAVATIQAIVFLFLFGFGSHFGKVWFLDIFHGQRDQIAATRSQRFIDRLGYRFGAGQQDAFCNGKAIDGQCQGLN